MICLADLNSTFNKKRLENNLQKPPPPHKKVTNKDRNKMELTFNNGDTHTYL